MRFVVAFVGILAACAGINAGTEEKFPSFVQELIRKFSTSPMENPPVTIWRYSYRGSEVYYIPPRCCDGYSEAYDSSG
jgi:hypothetical protein